MRRNANLMLSLLDACALNTALNSNDKGEIQLNGEAFTADAIKYHLVQLEEGGFIKNDPNAKKNPNAHLMNKRAIELAVYHVTPKGHDRLALPRNETFEIWS